MNSAGILLPREVCPRRDENSGIIPAGNFVVEILRWPAVIGSLLVSRAWKCAVVSADCGRRYRSLDLRYAASFFAIAPERNQNPEVAPKRPWKNWHATRGDHRSSSPKRVYAEDEAA